jgi:hypothetical protein
VPPKVHEARGHIRDRWRVAPVNNFIPLSAIALCAIALWPNLSNLARKHTCRLTIAPE